MKRKVILLLFSKKKKKSVDPAFSGGQTGFHQNAQKIFLFHILKKAAKIEKLPGFSYFIHLSQTFLKNSTRFDKRVSSKMLKYRKC